MMNEIENMNDKQRQLKAQEDYENNKIVRYILRFFVVLFAIFVYVYYIQRVGDFKMYSDRGIHYRPILFVFMLIIIVLLMMRVVIHKRTENEKDSKRFICMDIIFLVILIFQTIPILEIQDATRYREWEITENMRSSYRRDLYQVFEEISIFDSYSKELYTSDGMYTWNRIVGAHRVIYPIKNGVLVRVKTPRMDDATVYEEWKKYFEENDTWTIQIEDTQTYYLLMESEQYMLEITRNETSNFYVRLMEKGLFNWREKLEEYAQ